MAWYYGTFACGHEGRVNIIGPQKDREWKKERAFSHSCYECRQKEREERIQKENEESAKLSKEYEFPELTGSEKQVAWGNTIRMNLFKDADKLLKELKGSGAKRCSFRSTETGDEVVLFSDEAIDMIDKGFVDHTDAKFWIEHRYKLNYILTVFYDELQKRKDEASIPDEVKEEMAKEIESLTSRPEGGTKSGVVEIKFTKTSIQLYYPKDDDFRSLVKKYRYSWDGVWCRKITDLTGSFSDRAGEIGNALLANGFTVKFPDMVSKEKAVSGTFVPECNRWILKYADDEFGIWWYYQSDTIYDASRVLPGSHWRDGKTIVSVEYYNEVQEFADTLNFQFSKAALEMIEEYKKVEESYTIDKVSIPDNAPVSDQELLHKTLSHSGVIEDLKDDIE